VKTKIRSKENRIVTLNDDSDWKILEFEDVSSSSSKEEDDIDADAEAEVEVEVEAEEDLQSLSMGDSDEEKEGDKNGEEMVEFEFHASVAEEKTKSEDTDGIRQTKSATQTDRDSAASTPKASPRAEPDGKKRIDQSTLRAIIQQAKELKTGLVGDRKHHMKMYKECVSGSQLVDFIHRQHCPQAPRSQAVDLAQAMIKYRLLEHVSQDSRHFVDRKSALYRFMDDKRRQEISGVEMNKIYSLMKSRVQVRDRRLDNVLYKKCFIATDATTWLIYNTIITNRKAAVKLMERFRKAEYICPIDKKITRFKDQYTFWKFMKKRGKKGRKITEQDVATEL